MANITEFNFDNLIHELSTIVPRMDALRQLARGCPHHPTYRALRPPRVKCEVCQELRDIRLHLELNGEL